MADELGTDLILNPSHIRAGDVSNMHHLPQWVIGGFSVIELKTAPADFRFPTTNQTRHCFTRYVEFHRCIAAKGEESNECAKFAQFYRSLCPGEWVERWNEQRETGTFPGPL